MESTERTSRVNMICGGGRFYHWRWQCQTRPFPNLLCLQSNSDGGTFAQNVQRIQQAIYQQKRPQMFQVRGPLHSAITAKQLSERWNIGLAQSKQTLWVTTQRGVWSAILPLCRRYQTDRMYDQHKLLGQQFYTDTLFGKYKLVTNNTCAQLFANKSFFAKAYPMGKKSLAGSALLRQFIRDFGVPEKVTFDGSGKQTRPKTKFMKHVHDYAIDYHITEPNRPQQNRAKTVIQGQEALVQANGQA
jgi:hypothetical protein